MTQNLIRFLTGIAGLDTLLHGGLISNGLYLILGCPGAGKSTLASQISFYHVAQGHTVRYVTAFTETQARLLQHQRQFAFFDASQVGGRLSYISAFETLYSGGYQALCDFLTPMLRQERTSLIVLDGLPLNPPDLPYDPGLTMLLQTLGTYLEGTQTTCLILSPLHRRIWQSPVMMMVDGAIELQVRTVMHKLQRSITIRMLRGSTYEPGTYPMSITAEGVHVSVTAWQSGAEQ